MKRSVELCHMFFFGQASTISWGPRIGWCLFSTRKGVGWGSSLEQARSLFAIPSLSAVVLELRYHIFEGYGFLAGYALWCHVYTGNGDCSCYELRLNQADNRASYTKFILYWIRLIGNQSDIDLVHKTSCFQLWITINLPLIYNGSA